VTGREASGILWAACAVICLLLYGIFDALSEAVGRKTSLSFLVLLTAALLWLITKNSKLSYDHKVRWVAAVAGGMILILTGLLGSHPRVNPLFPSARAATAQAQAFPVASISSDNLPTSQRYWGVVKTKVGQSWNPSAVANIPAGATADIAFTISLDGSPHNVQLRKPSGYPSLDSSCVLAVQKVKTFGPPEGGAKDGLNVLYPCSYNELASMNAHALQGNTVQENATVLPSRPESAESIASQLGGYTEAAKNKVAQKWDLSEVAGSTPAGATVYMQFAIRRRGTHEVPTVQTPSGYLSLDVSCQAAVDRIQNFGPLPKAYGGDSLTVLYHCTYPGSSTAKIAQDSSLPAVQPTPANGTVNSGHGVQQPANDTVVKN
jgi:TonB family protein